MTTKNNQDQDEEAVPPNFGDSLGFEHLESPPGMAIIALKLKQEHCNRQGSVHGGVLLSLMDTAGLWANSPEDGSMPAAATASLNCNFLRAARLEKVVSLRAESQVTKRGRGMFFSTISVYACPNEELVATGQCVFSIAPQRN